MSCVISLPVKLGIIMNVVCFVSSRFGLHSELSYSPKASDVTEIASSSFIECARVCMRNNLCHIATYDRMTKRCRIFNDQTYKNCDVGLDVVQTSVFLKKVDEDCNSGWHLFEGNCYFFGVSNRSWKAAQNDCNERCSCLVTIQNERENNWLIDVIKNSDKNGARFWIGANDIDKEDNWVWESDESEVVFSNWHRGEPNSYGGDSGAEDCAEMKMQKSRYKWNDQPCKKKSLYICEK